MQSNQLVTINLSKYLHLAPKQCKQNLYTKYLHKFALATLLIATIAISNTSYATDSTGLMPAARSNQMQFCCQPNAPQLVTDYNNQNHGDARYWDQDCTQNQSGNGGASHAGYSSDVISGVFIDYGDRGNTNIGAKCSHIQASQYCTWVPQGTCTTTTSYTPNPPAPTN